MTSTKQKRGRPSKFTPKAVKAITAALAKGNYRVTAARAGAVSYETFLGWLAKGRAQRVGPMRDFYDAVIAAETKAEMLFVGYVAREAKLDAKHAKWMLSHRWRDRWADNPAKVELTGANGGPVKIEDARSRLLAKLEQLAARAAKK